MLTNKVVVIGAGIVGLAIGKKFASLGYETFIIEKNTTIASETSRRNSGVVHAGIYYEKDSLKAILCTRGNKLLATYCEKNHIPYRRWGKLIVATNESQVDALTSLNLKAKENNVTDLLLLDNDEVKEIEPNVTCFAALLSPSTAVLDIKSLAINYVKDYESNGGKILLGAECIAITKNDVFEIKYRQDGISQSIKCCALINSAGLSAPSIAKRMDFIPQALIPESFYAKGNYFKCNMTYPFNHLIYPLPESAGLGIHATPDIDGSIRFGPDVQWVDSPSDYHVDASRLPLFIREIKKYYPAIESMKVVPSIVGFRPKTSSKENQPQDFIIQGEEKHGCKGLINLFGIESPGLTASLSIADLVYEKVTKGDILHRNDGFKSSLTLKR